MKGKNGPDSIGQLLLQISRARRNRTNEMLASYGIHAGQDILLYYLGQEEGQTVSELVEKMCIQHATISNMIDRMQANDLLTKVKDKDDKRISRLFLTAKGQAGVKTVKEIWKTLETRTVKNIDEKEKGRLVELLQQMLKNIS